MKDRILIDRFLPGVWNRASYRARTVFVHVARASVDPILSNVQQSVGRGTATTFCPCCGHENRVYIWSFNGTGKRCDNCRALISRWGASLHIDRMSAEDWKTATEKAATRIDFCDACKRAGQVKPAPAFGPDSYLCADCADQYAGNIPPLAEVDFHPAPAAAATDDSLPF